MTDIKDLRIVSLLPSATEIVAALGLTDALVGRSHECDYPPEIQDRPVCTKARINSERSSALIHEDVTSLLQNALSIYDIKLDVLEKLKPTHILTQDQCDVCAVSVKEVEKAVAEMTDSHPQIISLQPKHLTDVWADIQKVKESMGADSAPVLKDLESRVKIVEQKTSSLLDAELLNVACIEWTDPLMIGSNWIPELVKIAGGNPLFSVDGQPSHLLKWESLVTSNPDVIIFMPCGFDLNRTRQEATLFVQQHLEEWQNLHAVKNSRVYITDGNAFFNRPGPRLADSLEILAEILHPEIFDYGYQHKAWELL
ncbi:MAG TPA: cobalamin-binding protein [Leptolyngbyaceae cyanobacterium]|nr:cobalamin-binding protein [Nostocaceae cyanobacterium]